MHRQFTRTVLQETPGVGRVFLSGTSNRQFRTGLSGNRWAWSQGITCRRHNLGRIGGRRDSDKKESSTEMFLGAAACTMKARAAGRTGPRPRPVRSGSTSAASSGCTRSATRGSCLHVQGDACGPSPKGSEMLWPDREIVYRKTG